MEDLVKPAIQSVLVDSDITPCSFNNTYTLVEQYSWLEYFAPIMGRTTNSTYFYETEKDFVVENIEVLKLARENIKQ
jgi:hypothetical protein